MKEIHVEEAAGNNFEKLIVVRIKNCCIFATQNSMGY